ncbi:MAG: hypothetical protein N4A64_07760 [Marinisporobacter sp.]|jgi:hypothetical protein|nr:hypothetical protein [Marinisporobacter sp.]
MDRNGAGKGGNGSSTGSDIEEKEYEEIFTPKYRGQGESSQIKGNINESGREDVTQVKKFGDTLGESVNYQEVLKNYKEGAYEKLHTKEIPKNMKEIVKTYFTELEQ